MKKYIILSLLAINASYVSAQGTIEDYKRANSIWEEYNGKALHNYILATNIEGTHKFWYSENGPEERVYKIVDADNNTCDTLFNRKELATAISNASGGDEDAATLYLGGKIRVNKDNTMDVEHKGAEWRYDLKSKTATKLRDIPKSEPMPHWMVVPDEKDRTVDSPDQKKSVFFKDNNLVIRDNATNTEKQLTTDGIESNYYSSWGSWSSDGKYFSTVKITPAPKRYVYYIESSPSDQLQPKLHPQEYAKPGDSLNYRVPVIIDVENSRTIVPSTELFKHQYYVTAPAWNKDDKSVTFEFNERGHKHYRVLEMSALTGKVRTLAEESSDKYVNYNMYFRHDFEDGKRMLWMSERDNYAHLYLYDKEKGKVIRQVTKGPWYVREVQKVDEKNGIIYFSANGVNKNEDPYLIHYYKIGINGKGMTCLTPEEGHHKAVYCDDMKYMIDTYSTVTTPPVCVLRSSSNGKIIKTLEKADISKLEAAGWKAPEVFVAKGRDGETDMWGIIQRPSNFDPNKKYPIIEYIYAGPGSQYVPKSFSPVLYRITQLAELGFIVVQLDAMGTSYRSKKFEEVCYKNLKDAGFPDRIAWIKSAAKKYPYMDADNVGIFGASAGGQEALAALLFHGDFYKAAYASCGCHDNRMDKIWWNEQWMSYPVDSSYIECSNTENASKLNRPLMLVVGELDDNVDPSSTFQVVNALIKANKNFEFVYLPGQHHTMGGKYGEHKRYDFFVKHLHGVDPPEWDKIK